MEPEENQASPVHGRKRRHRSPSVRKERGNVHEGTPESRKAPKPVHDIGGREFAARLGSLMLHQPLQSSSFVELSEMLKNAGIMADSSTLSRYAHDWDENGYVGHDQGLRGAPRLLELKQEMEVTGMVLKKVGFL